MICPNCKEDVWSSDLLRLGNRVYCVHCYDANEIALENKEE